MRINAPRVVAFFLLVALAIGFGFGFDAVMTAIERHKYPIREELRDAVAAKSEEYNIPEEILWATLHATGGFSSNKVSASGAIGLMQITPERFAEICTDIQGVELKDAGLLYDPMTNLDAGCAWLSYLYRYYGIWEHAHAAYYVGTETVDAWLSIPDYLNENGILTEIPDEAVAAYVRDVQKATEYYQKLYYAP